jgi:photosystem II stability/assembly factor-like uncharacterized protein
MIKGLTRVLASLVICTVAGGSLAAADPAKVRISVRQQSIPHAALFGLSFDAGKGVAVGAGGVIYESADAGSSWTAVNQSESQLALLAVDRRGAHTIAVGQMGEVLVEDSPGQWKKYDSGVPNRLLTVSVNSSGLAVAAGEFGTVLKSADGGHSWAASAPDWASMADKDTFGTQEPTIYASYVADNGEITIAGEFGVIMRSADAGATWHPVRPVQSKAPTIFAMQIVPAGEGNSYAVGQTGEFLASADGGAHWDEKRRGTSANLLGIAASKSGEVVITGMRTMMQSDDSGATFSFLDNDDTTTEWYQAVRTEPTTGHILAVGHAGRIIRIGG